MEFIGYSPLVDCVRLEFLNDDGLPHYINAYNRSELDAAPQDVREHAWMVLESVLMSKPEPEVQPDPGPEPEHLTPEQEIVQMVAGLSPEARALLKGAL